MTYPWIKPVIKILFLCLLLLLFYSFYTEFLQSRETQIEHLTEYQTYPPGKLVKLDDCDCQAVTYVADTDPEIDQQLRLPPNYAEFMEDFPEVCWIFYYDGSSVKETKFIRDHYRINTPIIMDTAGRFKELNPVFTRDVSFIAALYYKNGRVNLVNPTMPGYKQALIDCLGGR